jgi:hypothetical protein
MPGRGVFFVLAALAASGCAGDEVTLPPQATVTAIATADVDLRAVTCVAGTLRVAFDPANRVTVTRGGQRVVFASFDRRNADGACGAAVHRKTIPATDDGLLGGGISRRVELSCTATGPVQVAVHAILDGDHPGRSVGSTLTLRVGRTTILSAVLKNMGDPIASRVYRAKRVCRL